MSKTKRLAELYKKANSLNDELPKELIEKMELYGQVLEIIGGLHAESMKAWKLAEAKRREVIAHAIVYEVEMKDDNGNIIKPKTAKEKEAIGEVVGAEARREEALAEAEAQRWRNAYNSTVEMIQILKKKYEHMQNVSKGGV